MTIQELFIKLKYVYEKSGVQSAKRDVKGLTNEVGETGKSLDRLNKKFDALGIAATAAAGTAIASFRQLSEAMVFASGRAGLSMREFKNFARDGRKLSRETAVDIESTYSTFQKIYSSGLTDRARATRLTELALVLQGTGIAQAPVAGEAAVLLSDIFKGYSPQKLLQMMTATAQESPGTVEQYFGQARIGGASAQMAGVSPEEYLALLGIGAAGGDVSKSRAGVGGFLGKIMKDEQGRYAKAFASVTGGQWSDMRKIQQEQGTFALLRFLKENFGDNLYQIFEDRELVETMSLILANLDKYEARRDSIATAQQRDVIGQRQQDTKYAFDQIWKRLWKVLTQLWEDFGKGFAVLLSPLMIVLEWLGSKILELNDFLGGAIGILAAIATGLVVFRRILPMIAGTYRTLSDVSRGISEAFGGKDGKKSDKFDEKAFGTGLGSGALGGAIGATFAWGGAALLRQWRAITGMGGAILAGVRDGGWSGGHGEALYSKGVRSRFLINVVRTGVWLALLPFMKPLLAVLSAFAFLAGYSKIFDWNSPAPWKATRKDRQADFFRGGGKSGFEPPPGPADIAAANRAFAEAEKDLLGDELMALVRARLSAVRGWIPQFLVDLIDVPIEIIKTMFGSIHDIFMAWGMVIREFWADPRAAVGMVWDMAMGKSAEIDSAIYTLLIKALGGDPSEDAKALGNIAGGASIDSLNQPTISLTRKNLRDLGVSGDYSNLSLTDPMMPNLPGNDINLIGLPIPPTTGNPKTFPTKFEFNFGDINVDAGHPDDRFDIAKDVQDAIRDELRNSADYIIQEMDALSP